MSKLIVPAFNWDINNFDYCELGFFFIGFICASAVYLRFYERWIQIADIKLTYVSIKNISFLKQTFLEFLPRLIFSYIYIRLLNYLKIETTLQHFQLGIWVWLTLILTSCMPPMVWEFKKIDYVFFTSSEKLLALVSGIVLRQIYLNYFSF